MAEHPRIEELRRRVQKDPASIAFAQLAEEYRRAGRFEEAIDTCRTGLSHHPGYLSAHVTLGRALIETGDLETAHHELTRVLTAAPENLAALRGLADIHRRRGELADALAYYRRALDLARHDPELEHIVDQIAHELEPERRAPEVEDGLSFEEAVGEFLALSARDAPAPARPAAPRARARPEPASPGALRPVDGPPAEPPRESRPAAVVAPAVAPVLLPPAPAEFVDHDETVRLAPPAVETEAAQETHENIDDLGFPAEHRPTPAAPDPSTLEVWDDEVTRVRPEPRGARATTDGPAPLAPFGEADDTAQTFDLEAPTWVSAQPASPLPGSGTAPAAPEGRMPPPRPEARSADRTEKQIDVLERWLDIILANRERRV